MRGGAVAMELHLAAVVADLAGGQLAWLPDRRPPAIGWLKRRIASIVGRPSVEPGSGSRAASMAWNNC